MWCTYPGFNADEMIITPSNITAYDMQIYCSTGVYKIIIFICNLVCVSNITAIGGDKIYFFWTDWLISLAYINVNWLSFATKIDSSHFYVLHHALDGIPHTCFSQAQLLLLSNENTKGSMTWTKILHNTKCMCALTQSAYDKALQLRSWQYLWDHPRIMTISTPISRVWS